MEKTLVKDMSPGQYFRTSPTPSSCIWQKKGTKAMSCIIRETGEVISSYYFRQDDFGYCEFPATEKD